MSRLGSSRICRTCMGKKGEMRPLFGSCLDTMLMTVADVQVQPGDGLPETLCVQCVLQVSRAFNFKQVCQRSDASLREAYLKSIAAPVVDDAFENQDKNQVMLNYQDVDGINGKCVLILQNIRLIDGVDNEMLSMAGSDKIIDVESEIENNPRPIGDIGNSNDIGDLVSSLPIQVDDEMSNDFDSFSNDGCDAGDTDADNLLVTVASSLFDLHDNTDIGNMEYFCVECGLSFSQLHELTAHRSRQHQPNSETPTNAKKPFQCDICKKHFNGVKILRRHMKIHSAIKPHACSDCNMSFVERSNLTKHQKKHTGELRNTVGKPNLCSVCGKGFKWSSSLSKHMKHHTKRKLLNCPYCPKYYVEARSLNIHIRMHTGEKPFVCKICNKGFTQLGNLEKHTRVHTGEKPYHCAVCGKGFSQSGYVRIHMRTHTGEKPFRCDECGKEFAGSNTLAIHQRTHTGERRYSCKFCAKKFGRQSSAMIHERTHTGEKPHVCSICNRRFSSTSHMTSHMRTHSGVKEHECTVCHKKFAGSSSLKVHMRRHQVQKGIFSDLTLFEQHDFQHELVDETSLLQQNLHDGVISLVDDSMMLDHHDLLSRAEPHGSG